MIGHAVLAAGLAVSPIAVSRPEISVMTWNVCAGTNSACSLYRATAPELARAIGAQAGRGTDVLFLQEFCTGADAALEGWLERGTGRDWTVRSWGLTYRDGRPHSCHPDLLGRPRGTQSITVAAAGPATFEVHPMAYPPWSVRRAAVCAELPGKRVRACTSHLSVGLPYDDRQPGAPYRSKQVRRLFALTKPGYTHVFGGDLNLRPGARALAPVYGRFQECDPRRRPTMRAKKLDYLFTGRVLSCRLDARTRVSDHQPLHMRAAL
ncbi:endonuclease/exonuclease/phosphatase family protein [Nonomuraea typhae]|uniref:endonuclease/exonuclease/phosphatase family protein n=1 Tax=Nonomuraea typhae TaxID=2603600 RepID=UPI0012F8EDAB|nr:endonuclease/exonuclease/phosphatase family protein [Nonomuraea typhae]